MFNPNSTEQSQILMFFKMRVHKIYEKYIRHGSRSQVHVSPKVLEVIQDKLSRPGAVSIDIFHDAGKYF